MFELERINKLPPQQKRVLHNLLNHLDRLDKAYKIKFVSDTKVHIVYWQDKNKKKFYDIDPYIIVHSQSMNDPHPYTEHIRIETISTTHKRIERKVAKCKQNPQKKESILSLVHTLKDM